jgi:hypothetical protein
LDHTRFFWNDFEAGFTPTFLDGDVTVTKRSHSQNTDRTTLCGIAATAPATLENFGTLLFGHHPLYLQQQLVLGALAQSTIEKHHFHTGPLPFFDQQNRIGVATRQAIRRMNIDTVDAAGSNEIAELLQGWTDECMAAVAIIEELMFGEELMPIGSDALVQSLPLTGKGVRGDLVLARDAGIQSDLLRGPNNSFLSWVLRLTIGRGQTRGTVGTNCS